MPCTDKLYLIEILHQTTTLEPADPQSPSLYLIEILHQTTTVLCPFRELPPLYLIEILHQTTTFTLIVSLSYRCILSKFYIKPQLGRLYEFSCRGCILSKFYIKPQQRMLPFNLSRVVSYRNSTSNHNVRGLHLNSGRLYLIEILHQTTTRAFVLAKKQPLYLIEILHQTTTGCATLRRAECCILSKFYIKPQQFGGGKSAAAGCILSKFYIKPQRRASY